MRRPNTARRHAIVITHAGEQDRLIDLPWIEGAYDIDESDWVVLPADGWRAAAEGDAALWADLERKLLVGFYLNEPALVAVVGHPSGRAGPDPAGEGQREVRRIVRRVCSLLLPTAVIGFWADGHGWQEEPVSSGDSVPAGHAAFAPEREPVA